MKQRKNKEKERITGIDTDTETHFFRHSRIPLKITKLKYIKVK